MLLRRQYHALVLEARYAELVLYVPMVTRERLEITKKKSIKIDNDRLKVRSLYDPWAVECSGIDTVKPRPFPKFRIGAVRAPVVKTADQPSKLSRKLAWTPEPAKIPVVCESISSAQASSVL